MSHGDNQFTWTCSLDYFGFPICSEIIKTIIIMPGDFDLILVKKRLTVKMIATGSGELARRVIKMEILVRRRATFRHFRLIFSSPSRAPRNFTGGELSRAG